MFLVIGIVSICSAIYLFGNRIKGTGIERFLQMKDAVNVLCHGPVLGMGVGKWQDYITNNENITYKAALVHNSYLQIGIEAGIIVYFFVILILALYIKNIRHIKMQIWQLPVLMMMCIHFFFDFTVFFSSIILVFMVIGSYRDLLYCLDN